MTTAKLMNHYLKWIEICYSHKFCKYLLYSNRTTKKLIVLKLKMAISLLFNNMGEHEKFMNSLKVQEK